MSNSFRELIISELSSKLPPELVKDLISSYDTTLTEFRKGAWAETLWKAGKFAENVFRVLYFIVYSRVIAEVPQMNDLREKLEELPREKFSESVRILIPRITSSMIYDPRSKRGAVHVKPVDPDYLDSTLAVSAANWVLAELLQALILLDFALQRAVERRVLDGDSDVAGESYQKLEIHAGEKLAMLRATDA